MNVHSVEAKTIAPEQIAPEALAKFDAGWRLVGVTALVADERHVELLYHYDKACDMAHLRVKVPKDFSVPSISGTYFCALLVENEIQDLFGVRFKGLALDYQRALLLSEDARNVVNAPFFHVPASKSTSKRA
jgi:ech hydrogenase subunit D